MATATKQNVQAWRNTAKKSANKWKESRKAKPGEGFQVPEIEDGVYTVKVTGEVAVGDRGKLKGHALIRLTGTVMEGDREGTAVTQLYDLDGADWAAEAVARDLKCVLPEAEDEITSAEIIELPNFIETINANPPVVQAQVENGVSKTTGKAFVNIRFMQSEVEVSDNDESSDDEEVEEEESTEEEEVVEIEPEKGDTCIYTFRGKDRECEIVTVNRSNQTSNLKDKKSGAVHKAIAWDKLTWPE